MRLTLKVIRFAVFITVFAASLTLFNPPIWADTASGLLGFWNFNEGSGSTVNDLSSYGHNGTLRNSPLRTTGVSLGGLEFDGINDYVSLPSSAFNFERNSPFSISMWVKMPAVPAGIQRPLISKGSGGPAYAGWFFFATSAPGYGTKFEIVTNWQTGNTIVKGSSARVDDGIWHHVVVTYNGSSSASGLNIYTDGVLTNGPSAGGPLTGSMTNSSAVEIGAATVVSQFYQGKIDDVRAYNRVLTSSDVSMLHTGSDTGTGSGNGGAPGGGNGGAVTPPPAGAPGASAYWKFDEQSGSASADASGNGNNGSVQGATRATGRIGNALSFDGQDDVFAVSSARGFDGTGTMTYSAWIRPSSWGEHSTGAILEMGVNRIRWRLTRTGGMEFSNNSGFSRAYAAANSVSLNTWQHVAVVVNSQQTQFYVNGRAVPTLGGAGTAQPQSTLFIGNDDHSSRSFHGLIDDVRIHNRALTASELQSLVASAGGAAPPPPGTPVPPPPPPPQEPPPSNPGPSNPAPSNPPVVDPTPPPSNPAPSGGPLPRLRLSANGRYIERSDGRQFFWLADTAWFLPKLSQSDIEMYLANTAQKGFNAALINLATYYFEPVGTPPFLNNNPDTPNEQFWQKMDWMVDRANSYGIYAGLVLMWGPDFNVVFRGDMAKATRFGNWLGRRYGSKNNVFWVISGEYTRMDGSANVFNTIANAIHAAGGTQLMTIHPCAPCTSSKDFHHASWLDFNLVHSGHASDLKSFGLPENYELIARDYALSPARPVMDSEPAYEGHPDGVWLKPLDLAGPRIDAEVVRRKAYWAVFAGAAGHTYGHVSIEVMARPGERFPYFPSALWSIMPDWKVALNAPGRSQMRYLRALMESRPISNRVPDQSILASSPGSGLNHVRATRASNGQYAWIYIPTGGAVTVNMSRLAGPTVSASWYSPRDGSSTSIGQFSNAGTRVFDAPGGMARGNDWVLVLNSVGGSSALSVDETASPASVDDAVPAMSVEETVETGFGAVAPATDGLAALEFRQDGALTSESWLAASSPITSGRIYTEFSESVNTGVAIVNPNDEDGIVSFYFTDSNGHTQGTGSIAIPARSQVSKFVSEDPFSLPHGQATMTIESSVPVAVTALRGVTNAAGEFLLTPMPVFPLSATGPTVLPYFVDGAGWTADVVLVNPTDQPITGAIEFVGSEGSVIAEGSAGAAFPFTIAPASHHRLQTSGESASTQTGFIRILTEGGPAPAGFVVFEFANPEGTITSQFAIEGTPLAHESRLYVESNGFEVQYGLAISNASEVDTQVELQLTTLQGEPIGSTTVPVPAHGQFVGFIQQLPGFESLPASFAGVLRVSSATEVAVAGLRVRQNEHQEILTSYVPALSSGGASAADIRYFTHFARGLGYTSRFVIVPGSGAPPEIFNLFGDDGLPVQQ